MPELSLSVVVLTLNEEKNLPACLESVTGLTREIFVVDSGSTDATKAIAERYGARFLSHPFETHARQWSWALSEASMASDWVLALDADQRLTPELEREIERTLSGSAVAADGYYLRRRQIFRGKWIRHGGYYPKYLLKLFRRAAVSTDGSDRVDHHFHVAGRTARLGEDLLEDNRNESSISDWTAKHVRYARLQAIEEIERIGSQRPGSLIGSPDARVELFKRWWRRAPLFVRPFAYFLYRYLLRLGFLDGKEGLIFHFLQGCWYRFLVDVNIDELRRSERSR